MKTINIVIAGDNTETELKNKVLDYLFENKVEVPMRMNKLAGVVTKLKESLTSITLSIRDKIPVRLRYPGYDRDVMSGYFKFMEDINLLNPEELKDLISYVTEYILIQKALRMYGEGRTRLYFKPESRGRFDINFGEILHIEEVISEKYIVLDIRQWIRHLTSLISNGYTFEQSKVCEDIVKDSLTYQLNRSRRGDIHPAESYVITRLLNSFIERNISVLINEGRIIVINEEVTPLEIMYIVCSSLEELYIPTRYLSFLSATRLESNKLGMRHDAEAVV